MHMKQVALHLEELWTCTRFILNFCKICKHYLVTVILLIKNNNLPGKSWWTFGEIPYKIWKTFYWNLSSKKMKSMHMGLKIIRDKIPPGTCRYTVQIFNEQWTSYDVHIEKKKERITHFRVCMQDFYMHTLK